MTEPTSTSATSVAVTCFLRLAEKAYEVVIVDPQAQDLLETTNFMSTQLMYAKKLRHQNSDLMSNEERVLVDRVILATEKAVHDVTGLLEPARKDTNVPDSQIRLSNRSQFAFCATAHIPTGLSKLNVAASDLNMALTLLCNKEGFRNSPSLGIEHDPRPMSPPVCQESEWSEWLYVSRQKNLRRRASALPADGIPVTSSKSPSLVPTGIVELADSSQMGRQRSSTCIPELPGDMGLRPAQNEVVEHPGDSELPPGMFRAELENNTMCGRGNSLAMATKDGAPSKVDSSYGRLEPPTESRQPSATPRSLVGSARSRSWFDYHMHNR